MHKARNPADGVQFFITGSLVIKRIRQTEKSIDKAVPEGMNALQANGAFDRCWLDAGIRMGQGFGLREPLIAAGLYKMKAAKRQNKNEGTGLLP